ncbi:hypothetical protein Y032_0007g3376 [Ancylostoma ceylanicum]|uniref:Uncharacterized protein n=1 Tax=Ancylostoma ceylanicum TaxID=53326 RepID=A0A016VN21_9BILA|nr:hypothetical protein Y032_0007g3376 [Ancylostoma ceylanicum]
MRGSDVGSWHDVNTQLSLAQVRQLKERVELAGRRLRRLVDETRRNEEKLSHMRRRQKTLESDLNRRLEIEKSGTPDVDGEVLRELEKPLDYEIETAQQFQARMAHVRHLMAELLVRTNLNEWAAHTEMAEQESEVVAKMRDACKARGMLRAALLDSKAKAEKLMGERKSLYEDLQRLEAQLEVCSAETWLATTEKNRLSDRLAILSKEPQPTPCERARRAREEKERETTQTENSVEVQLEVKPKPRSFISESSGSVRSVGMEQGPPGGSEGSSTSRTSSQTQEQENIVLPVNIMATIKKAIQDSMGLDVKFD